jgi:O-antigen/teichoic acid export membrane protein
VRVTEPAHPTSATVTSQDLAKGVGTTLLARLGAVIDVVAQPLYVWLFGLASYGLYATLWSAINLIENVADLGMTSALQRVIPKSASEAEAVAALRAALLYGLTPCLIIAAAASALAPLVAPVFNASATDSAALVSIIRLFVWALPLWAFVEIATSAVRARRAFGAEIRLRLVWEQAIRLALAVVFYAAGFATMALYYAHLTSLAVTAVLSVRLLARYFDLSLLFKATPAAISADTLKAGLAVLPANIVARLFSDGPAIILNAILPGSAGAVAAGLYAIVRKISSIVQLVRAAFGYVLAPLAAAASTGNAAAVTEIYGFATRVSVAMAIPLGLVMIAGSPALLGVFGSGAAVAIPALAILILSRIIEAVTGSAGPIQQVTRSYTSQLAPSLLGLGVAAALGFALLPAWGLLGMVIAVAAGLVTASTTPLIQLWAVGRLHPFEAPFGRTFAVAMLVSLGGFALGWAAMALPVAAQLPLLIVILLATLWLSLRHALSLTDRQALGKTGRALRLA